MLRPIRTCLAFACGASATIIAFAAIGRAEQPPAPGRPEPAASASAILQPGENILFLGDSITQAGTYVAFIETYLWDHFPDQDYRLINLGLGSETASGLSEPDHPFPRPCIHTRLDRVIAAAKPDLTFVCYGMNDGIYHPPSPERRTAYRDGMRKLIDQLRDAGSRVILITPPPFDATTARHRGQQLAGPDAEQYGYKTPFADYDGVLEEYGRWVLAPKRGVEQAIDVHAPLEAYIARRRSAEPMFPYGDGIHPDSGGHFVFAQTILRELRMPGAERIADYSSLSEDSPLAPVVALALRRHRLLSAAWREHVGHSKPGQSDALPLAEAQRRAEEMELEIRRLLP